MRKGDISLTEDEYLEVIRRKTAVLFEAACRTSAILADANDEDKDALTQFGCNLGMAFQMMDDLFDYTLDTTQFGKEVGADLKEGKLTLPVIYTLKHANSSDREIMIKIIKDDNFSVEDFKTLVGMLEKYGGTDYTEKMAAVYIQAAKDALSIFDPSQSKEIMLDIADYVLLRRV
jgi:octaprenyl-diphosphate synthase